MTALLLLFISATLIELVFHPRLEYTREGKLLMFYGRANRKYIILN